MITYVNNMIQVDNQKWHEYNTSNIDIECQWLELKFKHQRNVIIANLYRPPQGNVTNFISYLENILGKIRLENLDIFIMGDFNIDFSDKGIETTRKLENLIKQ